MGKKKTIIVGEEETKKQKTEKKAIRAGKGEGHLKDTSQAALEEADKIAAKQKETTAAAVEQIIEEGEAVTKKAAPRKRGRRFLAARQKIDRARSYPLTEAVKLMQETSISRFPGSVELHLVVREAGLSGDLNFPHSNGQTQRIAIADDDLLEKIKKGIIDFDLLLATPDMMGKLAPLARILGPRGLMPNPKKGTITTDPQRLIKEMAGKTQYHTEKKAPLIHLVVGKTDQPAKELAENLETVFKAIGVSKIQKAVLTSTMGPGIKIQLEK